MSTEKNIEVVKKFQGLYPDAILTGSLAICFYGFHLGRPISDLDFVMPINSMIPQEWLLLELPPELNIKVYRTNLDEVSIDILLSDEVSEVDFNGIKLATMEDILFGKKDLALTGTKKHIEDFYEICLQLWERMVATRNRIYTQEDSDVFAMSFAAWYAHAEDAQIYRSQKLPASQMLALYKDRPFLRTDSPEQN